MKVRAAGMAVFVVMFLFLPILTPFPRGFSWTDAPIQVFTNCVGGVYTGFDASDFMYVGAGVTYYVDVRNGSDKNDGLTPETAFKSVHKARGMDDVDIIMVAEGYYEDQYGFDNRGNQNKNLSIIAMPGADVTISTRRFLRWQAVDGYDHVYHSSRTKVASVWDSLFLDEYGDYTKYVQLESIEEVKKTPGSFYYVDADLYVHPLNSRPADDDVVVFLDVRNLYVAGDYLTYVEGIKFYGGNAGAAHVTTASESDNPLFVAKNSEFKYSSGGNGGVAILGADAIIQNSTAARNHKDGFNYHSRHGRTNKVIEVGVTGRHNGIGRNKNQDNGSSIHDGGKIIRVNGQYFENEGPNVHDINPGTESWNIGVKAFNSAATVASRRSNFRVENGAVMWIDRGQGYGSDQAIFVGKDSKMHLRAATLSDGEEVILGEISSY